MYALPNPSLRLKGHYWNPFFFLFLLLIIVNFIFLIYSMNPSQLWICLCYRNWVLISDLIVISKCTLDFLFCPAFSRIFYASMDDNQWFRMWFSLAPRGRLRVYLERLAMADNVQKYVQQNPFGQRAITKSSATWTYYSKVVRRYSYTREEERRNSSACQHRWVL